MINKKLGKMMLTAGLATVLVFAAAACGGSGSGGSSKAASSAAPASSAAASSAAPASSAAASSAAPASSAAASSAAASSAASQSAELSDKDLANLLQQIADKQLEKRYTKFLSDKEDMLFAVAEVFGIDRKDNTGTMYARVNASEYINFKGKAYNMQGIAAEGIFTFEYTANGPKLKDIQWSADAAAHDPWMKQNYPDKYYKAWQAYKPEDASGNSKLNSAIDAAASNGLGVPVDNELLLSIEDDGSYELVKTSESGSGANYQFNTEVVDKGKI